MTVRYELSCSFNDFPDLLDCALGMVLPRVTQILRREFIFQVYSASGLNVRGCKRQDVAENFGNHPPFTPDIAASLMVRRWPGTAL